MEFVDYYRTMGVDESASADEIRRAYRKLARKYHPDVSKVEDAEKRFKEVGEAYEVLKDPEKRAEYDALRKYRDQAGNFQPPPGWEQQSWQHAGQQGGEGWAGDHQFSDFFESLFGRRAQGDDMGREFSARGGDLHYVLPITLEEAYAGGKRSFTLEQMESLGDGRMAPRTRNITVTIPRGVVSGQHLRLKGKGNPGMGRGGPGDLFLEIELKPHPRYSVEGRDITMGLPVAPWELALGATIDVPTPGGAVKLTVPPNTRPGQKLRMKGRGLPGNPAGDQYVIMQVVMPQVLSESDRKLFEQMKRQMNFDPREQLVA